MRLMALPFNAVQAASGLNAEEVAKACGISKSSYDNSRLSKPGYWRLRELKLYYNSIEDYAKPLLLQAVTDFICS